jgi:hypothetical protein
MGFIPPPPPLESHEFHRRWEKGARTVRELDPAFAAWLDETRNSNRWKLIPIAASVLLIIITACAVRIARL